MITTRALPGNVVCVSANDFGIQDVLVGSGSNIMLTVNARVTNLDNDVPHKFTLHIAAINNAIMTGHHGSRVQFIDSIETFGSLHSKLDTTRVMLEHGLRRALCFVVVCVVDPLSFTVVQSFMEVLDIIP